MNIELMKDAGFGEEVKLVQQKICPVCQEKIDENGFRNKISKKEYTISGLCQKCQDSVFGID